MNFKEPFSAVLPLAWDMGGDLKRLRMAVKIIESLTTGTPLLYSSEEDWLNITNMSGNFVGSVCHTSDAAEVFQRIKMGQLLKVSFVGIARPDPSKERNVFVMFSSMDEQEDKIDVMQSEEV